MGISVERITLDDAVSFRAAVNAVAAERLYLARFEAPPLEKTVAFIKENLAVDNPQVVVREEGEVIGWCDIVRDGSPLCHHVGVLGMGVLAAHRGRGLGRALLSAALDHARHIGLHKVALHVRAKNTSAIALYTSFGFEEEGRLRDDACLDGVFEDTLVMGLFLAGRTA